MKKNKALSIVLAIVMILTSVSIGVPTFAVIYYIIELIIDGRLHRKNLPESSDYYDEYSFVDDTGKYVISRETMEKKHKEKCEKEKSMKEKGE